MDRTQKVLFKSCLSERISGTSGVPQVSHLCLVFFCLFINDLPNIIQKYVDDVKILYALHSFEGYRSLEFDLCLVPKWCKKIEMFLNINML